MSQLKLGKKPATKDERDLLFSRFVNLAALPTPPSYFGHAGAWTNWKMLGNGPDETVAPGFGGAGDCVFAGAGHETMLWNKLGGKTARFTGANSISDYSAVTGYVIGDDSTDQGTMVRDALKYRKNTGIVDYNGKRHKIGAYIRLDPKSWTQLMTAVYIFGSVGIGFEFPDSAMEQFDAGERWDVVPGAQIEGGHYVPVMGRPAKSLGSCVTWAKRKVFTRNFYETYNDESWVMVSEEELVNGKNERGFDFAALNNALAQINSV